MIFPLALYGLIATAPDTQPFAMLCRSWACVERRIAEGYDSPNLSRLRVFRGKAPGVLMSGETISRPLLDLRFQ